MIVNKDKAAEAAEVLGVALEGLDTASLAKTFRTKSRYYHPDTAAKFDADKWERICWAKRVLLLWLDKNPGEAPASPGACRACDGTGRIKVARPHGFSQKVTTVMCVPCGGSGSLPDEKASVYDRGSS